LGAAGLRLQNIHLRVNFIERNAIRLVFFCEPLSILKRSWTEEVRVIEKLLPALSFTNVVLKAVLDELFALVTECPAWELKRFLETLLKFFFTGGWKGPL
jgi:hypothetical protein